MEANLPNTSVEAWKLNEAGLSIVPLGSPFEVPPVWFVDGRCSGDIEKAKTEWPKAPRFRWKQYQDEAPDDSTIDNWTKLYPHTNWAIITGYRVVVVDADSAEAVQFIEEGAITRTPLRAITSKGKHYYFQVNPDYPVHNSVRKNKIDLRGIGGYVVAPGSTHADGTLYQWETDGYMEISDLHDLPMLTPDDIATINGFNGQAAEDKPMGDLGFSTDQYPLPHDGSNLAEGQGRNNAAASMAGQLLRQNNSLREVKAILDQWNQSNNPPLSDTELNTTIASITRTHANNHPGSSILIEPLPVTKPEFAFSHVKELVKGVKPINWLIKGFLEMDSLSLMFGEPACGKSFTAIDLACCVATGKDWHGKPVKRQGPVFYIAGEGFNGLSRRLMAWQVSHGYNLRNAPIYISQCAASLTDLGNARLVSASIEEIVEETGGVIPSMIVIDTLARNFGPADENATKEMNTFINHIDQLLRAKYSCNVLIVHHTGVGSKDRARGNSALKGALDAEYAVVKSDDEVTITAKKMKDADEPEPLKFLFDPIRLPFVDEEGEPQYSCVLKHYDPNMADGLKSKNAPENRIGERQVKIIETLNRLIANAQETLHKSGRDPLNARIELQNLKDDCYAQGFICSKHWRRTIDTMIYRGFVAVDAPFVSVTEKGQEAIKND
ncbi:AAA family ATPase [Salinisphaera sp. G21_0]|uniref:AAA family ATPase n=1 Tax=Salinisphaera sp. G21_0 TaxID=2821094 RepID=UPI001ADBA016|nr:AAA family ATPase [Salinisphaera sp. G21_0]MBO9484136.1 AAA family ATPase [Salinisphaera sp. G21_0]